MQTPSAKAAKMTNLLESCGGFAEALKLFREACASSFGEERTAEFVCLENALYDAEEAAQALDDATA